MGRGHVNQRRTEIGTMFLNMRTKELERMNSNAEVTTFHKDSPNFEIYIPPKRRKVRSDYDV